MMDANGGGRHDHERDDSTGSSGCGRVGHDGGPYGGCTRVGVSGGGGGDDRNGGGSGSGTGEGHRHRPSYGGDRNGGNVDRDVAPLLSFHGAGYAASIDTMCVHREFGRSAHDHAFPVVDGSHRLYTLRRMLVGADSAPAHDHAFPVVDGSHRLYTLRRMLVGADSAPAHDHAFPVVDGSHRP